MQIDFADSPRGTLGIEWELGLVDRTTRELVPAGADVLSAVDAVDENGFNHLAGEFLTNTVEVITGVHHSVGNAIDDLRRTTSLVQAAADARGIALLGSGTHPFSTWRNQHVGNKDRYQVVLDRTQWWGRQMVIYGVHVHIGVDDKRKVIPILNALLTYFPHFQALSSSSPYWEGDNTGYASNRALLFQQLPTAGLPPQFADWAGFESMVDDIIKVGVIDQVSEARWDIRPAPHWGTIEIRAFDCMPTLAEIGAVAALAQSLVEWLSDSLDRGETLPVMPPWFVRENKWRAARYGMDAIIIQDAAGNERLVTEDLPDLLDTLEPFAARFGSVDQLRSVEKIVAGGASYQRQLAAAEAAEGKLTAVVDSLVAELESGL